MTNDEAKKLKHGVYRLIWKDDEGASVASVGYNAAGDVWFAPANWISVPSYDWSMVERAQLISEQIYGDTP